MSSNRILQNQDEEYCLNSFLKTNEGKQFVASNNIVSFSHPDRPDFVAISAEGKRIGIELRKFYYKTKHGDATQSLMTIGEKVCQYCRTKYYLNLELCFTLFDQRKFSPNFQDHYDLCINPGFTKLFNSNKLKEKIINILEEEIENIKKGLLVQKWIIQDGEYIKIDLIISLGNFVCNVNNAGFCKKDPIDEIQKAINEKNKKYSAYRNQCDECYLLLLIPSVAQGNYCYITEDTFKHKFNTCFDGLFIHNVKYQPFGIEIPEKSGA